MKEVIKIFKQIQNTKGLNDKKAIITANKDNELFKKCLKFLLDGNIVTGISNSKISKVNKNTTKENATQKLNSFEEVMNYLEEHNTGRNEDVANIRSFIYDHYIPGNDEFMFYVQMITKKFRLGADAKLINSCIPDLIPTFDVMLGTPVDRIKLNGNEKIFISRKLNGTRCSFVGDKCMTRQGKVYTGLEHIINDLKTMGYSDYFIDGELLYKNIEGLSDSDAFQKGTGIANSKSNDKSELKFVVFDIFLLNEFWSGKSKDTYAARKERLLKIKENIALLGIENIEVVPMLYEGDDHSEIWKWLDYAEKNDWEGVMINLDAPYECKRTKNLLKVKRFKEIDLRCIKVNIADSGRYKGVVGSITCKYGNSTVDVGSGFNDEARKYYTDNPSEILNHIITVKYKEETKSKNGSKSLQFPIFITCRFDKNIADDET